MESIWEALGIPEKDRESLDRRSNMMIALSDFIQEKRWSKRRAARFFHVSTLTMKSLIKGHISDLSEDTLFQMCCYLPIMKITEEAAAAITHELEDARKQGKPQITAISRLIHEW